ncbi:MAG: oligosaccharide flippase family protein [bacterium]
MEKIEKKSLKEIVAKNVFHNFSLNIISNIFSFAFVIFLARILQPELYGIYGLVLSIVLLFSRFTDLGINTTVIRFVSKSLKNKKEARAYTHYLFKIKMYLVLSLSLIMILLAKPLSVFVFKNPALTLPLIISVLYLFISSITEFSASLFSAFNEFKYHPKKELVFQISRFITIFLFIFLIGKTVLNIFIALSISYALTFVFVFIIVRKKYAFLFKDYSLKSIFPKLLNYKYPGFTISQSKRIEILRYIAYLAVTAMGTAFFVYISTIMLGAFIDAKYIGFYRLAYGMVAMLIGFCSVGTVLFPVFSFLEKKRLGNVFKKTFKYSMVLTFPIAFIVPVTFKPLIILFYGIEYAPSIIPLYFLSTLVITETAFLYPRMLFYARGKPEWPVKIMIVSSILNILLNYFLIKYFLNFSQMFATVGATMAIAISSLFYFILMAIATKKELNIGIEASSILKPLLASSVMALFLLFINEFIILNWFIAGVEIILGIIFYFLVMLLIKGVNKEEFLLFKYIFRK